MKKNIETILQISILIQKNLIIMHISCFQPPSLAEKVCLGLMFKANKTLKRQSDNFLLLFVTSIINYNQNYEVVKYQ